MIIAFQAAGGLLGSPIVTLVFLIMWMLFTVILLVFIMLSRGPAMAFIKAKVKGNGVLIAVGKDRMATVESTKYKTGAFESANSGWFGVGLNSIYPTRKARIPIGIAFDPIGITLDPRYVKAIEQLKKMKLPYEVILEKVLTGPDGKPKRGEGGHVLSIETKEVRTDMSTLSDLQNFLKYCDYHKMHIKFDNLDDEQKLEHLTICKYCSLRNEGIDIPRETVSIQEIGGFVEKNINPSFIQSNIDTAVRIALNEQKEIPMKWIILLPTIIIFSAIAAAILFQVIGTGSPLPAGAAGAVGGG
tara:strand:- start:2280 stop:3182 length:903 start_codon:yes stop_codon:yes gene_type:complete